MRATLATSMCCKHKAIVGGAVYNAPDYTYC